MTFTEHSSNGVGDIQRSISHAHHTAPLKSFPQLLICFAAEKHCATQVFFAGFATGADKKQKRKEFLTFLCVYGACDNAQDLVRLSITPRSGG